MDKMEITTDANIIGRHPTTTGWCYYLDCSKKATICVDLECYTPNRTVIHVPLCTKHAKLRKISF